MYAYTSSEYTYSMPLGANEKRWRIHPEDREQQPAARRSGGRNSKEGRREGRSGQLVEKVFWKGVTEATQGGRSGRRGTLSFFFPSFFFFLAAGHVICVDGWRFTATTHSTRTGGERRGNNRLYSPHLWRRREVCSNQSTTCCSSGSSVRDCTMYDVICGNYPPS